MGKARRKKTLIGETEGRGGDQVRINLTCRESVRPSHVTGNCSGVKSIDMSVRKLDRRAPSRKTDCAL